MFEKISLYLLPVIILLILTTGLIKKVPVYEEFIEDELDEYLDIINKSNKKSFICFNRLMYNDETIGGMIVCDSQAQARNVFSDLADYDLSKALIL